MPQIKSLSLVHCAIPVDFPDADALAALSNFTSLTFDDCGLTSTVGLERLTWLKDLSLFYNPDITQAMVDALQKSMPDCYISFENAKS